MENYRELFLQMALYFSLFNLLSLLSASVSFFVALRNNTVADYCFFAVSWLLTLAVLLKFLVDPDPFGFFRYSFRYTAKSCCSEVIFNHHLIFWLCVSSAFVSSALLPNLQYIGIAILSVLLVFTIVVRPFKERFETVRSSLNVVCMLCVLGVKMTVQLYPSHFQNLYNSLPFNILCLCAFCLLPLLCCLTTVVCIVYA